MVDYSGFYYNVEGPYENMIYYISPVPEQKLYMIRKFNEMVNTRDILKSIETGFNGYDYEVYGIELLSMPIEVEEADEEWAVASTFTDFSNKQQFNGYILIPESMPMFDNFFKYILTETKDKVALHHAEHIKKQSKQQPRQHVQQVQQTAQPTPQYQAQQNARTIASQIVQNNDQNNNNQ